jgi:hypothetical protein
VDFLEPTAFHSGVRLLLIAAVVGVAVLIVWFGSRRD